MEERDNFGGAPKPTSLAFGSGGCWASSELPSEQVQADLLRLVKFVSSYLVLYVM